MTGVIQRLWVRVPPESYFAPRGGGGSGPPVSARRPLRGHRGGKTRLCQRKRGGSLVLHASLTARGASREKARGSPHSPLPAPHHRARALLKPPWVRGTRRGGHGGVQPPFCPPTSSSLLEEPLAPAVLPSVSASSRTDVGRMPEDEAIPGPEVDPRTCSMALSPVRDEIHPLRVWT